MFACLNCVCLSQLFACLNCVRPQLFALNCLPASTNHSSPPLVPFPANCVNHTVGFRKPVAQSNNAAQQARNDDKGTEGAAPSPVSNKAVRGPGLLSALRHKVCLFDVCSPISVCLFAYLKRLAFKPFRCSPLKPFAF